MSKIKSQPWEQRAVAGLGRFVKRLLIKDRKMSDPKGIIDRADVRRQFIEAEQMLKQAGPHNFQAAVLAADKLLDWCLKGLGAQGETLGERLKNSRALFSSRVSYQAAWDGHKARNFLVHEHEGEFLFHQARAALEQYRQALKGLGVI